MHSSRSARTLATITSAPYQRGSSEIQAIKQILPKHDRAMRIRKLRCTRRRDAAPHSYHGADRPRRPTASKQPSPRHSVRCGPLVLARCNLPDTARLWKTARVVRASGSREISPSTFHFELASPLAQTTNRTDEMHHWVVVI
ncbi:hypothetical protein PMIN06_006831 [Paraphaeosphaeria minitans]